ncbi:CwfJ C-terminus 1-domain-containing protein-like protein [Chytridium lagenaria]|nr:CwfJ C-terminus 1-domain-containing protein-like protein [Chytridium lagenaria]
MKLLVVGSVNGQFEAFFAKVSTMHKKHGPFDLMLCCGDFFSGQETDEQILALLKGKIIVPISTYIIRGGTFIPAKVVFYSPEDHSVNIEDPESSRHYSGHIVASLASGQSLSSINSKARLPPPPIQRAPPKWQDFLQPRYHFAGGPGFFFEREPYKNKFGASHPSRFIGLGEFGAATKERWFYAFNITPMASLDRSSLSVLPPNCTENPFNLNGPAGKRPREEPEDNGNGSFFFGEARDKRRRNDAPPSSYLCRICNTPGHYISDCPQKGGSGGPPGHPSDYGSHNGRGKVPPTYICRICGQGGHHIRECPSKKPPLRDLAGCWFCLSNPKLEKHLIVNIGSEAYVALAKGGISEWGGHLLIVPLGHYTNMRTLEAGAGATVTLTEVDRIKREISKAFQKRGEEAIFFETYSVIPVPQAVLGQVTAAFEETAAKEGMEIVSRDGTLPANTSAPYFSFDIPSADGTPGSIVVISPSLDKLHEMEVTAYEIMAGGRPPPRLFDINFGRRVLSELIGTPERAHWKRCILPLEEEKKLTQSVRDFLNLEM